ncbi:MAG: SAM-dependent methyltransferase [Elusimicrobiota bacterium]
MPKAADSVKNARRLAERAEAAAASNDMDEAIRLIDASLKLSPRDGERRLRSVFFRTSHRLYEEARKEFALAAAELPSEDARPARALAHLEYVQGRYEPALAAMRMIRAPYFQDHFLRGVLLARLGRTEETFQCLEELRPQSAGWAELLKAFQKAIAGDWAEASAAADRAAAAEKPLEQPVRLSTARAAFKLKAWQSRPGGVPKFLAEEDAPRGRLRLISLGADPPRNLTLDSLQAIGSCDVLFVNVCSDLLMDLLVTFCPGEVRPITFISKNTRKACARTILAALGPGRTVGYASYGHVMLYGPLTELLTRMSRRNGIPFTASAGVSIIDRVLADSGVVLGDAFRGFQLYDASDLAEGTLPLNGAAALAVYIEEVHGEERSAFYGRVQETILTAYPAAHEALLWGSDGSVQRLRVGELAAAHERLDGSQQLYVPPLRSPLSRSDAPPRRRAVKD